jgi:xylitol oxidase
MLTNWAGNHRYIPAGLERPGSVEELQRVVAGADQVRARGSPHSFTDIADTEGVLVSLGQLRARADPDGKFGNAFLDRILGGPPRATATAP